MSPIRTHVTITVEDKTKPNAVARLISFDTPMSVKEVLQSLSVSATLLKHYQPKEPLKP